MVRVVVCDGPQAAATALGGPAAACDGRALQADEIASGPPETSEAEVDSDAVADNGLPEKGLATVPEEESQEDGRASGVGASFQ